MRDNGWYYLLNCNYIVPVPRVARNINFSTCTANDRPRFYLTFADTESGKSGRIRFTALCVIACTGVKLITFDGLDGVVCVINAFNTVVLPVAHREISPMELAVFPSRAFPLLKKCRIGARNRLMNSAKLGSTDTSASLVN